MAKPTTIRIPEDLLNEINELVQELSLDRSAYLRDVLRKGFSLDKQDRLFLKYVRKELSQMDDMYLQAKAVSSQCCVSACSPSESESLLTKCAL